MNQERSCSINGCPAYRQSPLQSLKNAEIDLERYISLRQNIPYTKDEKPSGSCVVLSGEDEKVIVERGAGCGVGEERYQRWHREWKKSIYGQDRG